MKRDVRLRVNGRPVTLQIEASRTLLWVLRGDLELTGTKYGCGTGLCGSCTVVANGQAVRSCLTTVAQVEGQDIVTVEGLAHDGALHALQRAFIDHGALQCGYCTPGMLMRAYALLREEPRPSRARIAEAMDENLCRCGAHLRILAAIEAASREGARG